jgi:hypothetical protein
MKIMYVTILVFNVMITVGIKEKLLYKISEHLFEICQSRFSVPVRNDLYITVYGR